MAAARIQEDAAVAAFLLFLALLCGLAWLNPVYEWDVLPYAALAETHSSDPVRLHHEAYRTVTNEVPREVAQYLVFNGPDTSYRRDLASDPWHFAEQLPFYSVKPLYVLTLSALRRAGLNPVKGARLISLVSFLVMGGVLFLWVRRVAGTTLAAISAGCVSATPEFLRTGALVYPDAYFSAVALAALYLIFARDKLFPGICLLALLPFIRPDGIILVGLVVGYLAWKNPELSLRHALIIFLSEGLAYWVIGRSAGGFGYRTLFYHSFVNRLTAPAEMNVHVGLQEYWGALKYFFLGSIGTPRPLFFMLGLVSLAVKKGSGVLQHLAWLGLAYALVHIVLFPLPESRFLVVPFALFVLWAINALASRVGPEPRRVG